MSQHPATKVVMATSTSGSLFDAHNSFEVSTSHHEAGWMDERVRTTSLTFAARAA